MSFAGIDARDGHQRAQAGLGGAGERAQAAADERAVLADERHDVGDRGQRDEVEVLLERARAAAASRRDRRRAHRPPRASGGVLERLGELEGDGGGAEVGARVAAERRVHDRRVGQHAVGAGGVVVGDDDLHPERLAAATSSTAVIAQSTVTSRRVPRCGEPLDGEPVQAVAVGGAVGQVPVDVARRAGAASGRARRWSRCRRRRSRRGS